MDFSNDSGRSDLEYPDGMSPPCGTLYPEQQPRFRRSTHVNVASNRNRETVSKNFPFSPICDNYCSTLPDSGIGRYTPLSSNVGSTVLTPVQRGGNRTDSSEFVVENGGVNQCAGMHCVRRMWFILKMFLFGIPVSVMAVVCFWCARKSSTFDDFIMKEDCMLYVVVAITAVFTVLVTIFLKNLSCEQPATTGNWSMNNSSILQRRTNSHQSPSMFSNQHPELLQERHRSFSPMPSYVPDTPTFGIVKLPQQWFGIAMSVRLEFGVMNGTV